MDDTLTVRFRVGVVYKNCAIATYFDDQLISKRKRPVMAPGEMEQVILDKKKLGEYPDLSKITIKIEEASLCAKHLVHLRVLDVRSDVPLLLQ